MSRPEAESLFVNQTALIPVYDELEQWILGLPGTRRAVPEDPGLFLCPPHLRLGLAARLAHEKPARLLFCRELLSESAGGSSTDCQQCRARAWTLDAPCPDCVWF